MKYNFPRSWNFYCGVVENLGFFFLWDMTSCHVVNCYLQGSTDRVTKLRHAVLETFQHQLIIHFEAGVMCFLKIVSLYRNIYIYIYIYCLGVKLGR